MHCDVTKALEIPNLAQDNSSLKGKIFLMGKIMFQITQQYSVMLAVILPVHWTWVDEPDWLLAIS